MFNLLALSSVALALASNVVLTVESSDLAVNGTFLQNIHFGAGLNGVLLTSSPVFYGVNSTDSTVYETVEISDGPMPFVLGDLFGQLVAEAGAINIPAKLNGDGYLTINGSTTAAYACDKLSWDPYRLASAERKGVALYGAKEEIPDYCTPIKIKAN